MLLQHFPYLNIVRHWFWANVGTGVLFQTNSFMRTEVLYRVVHLKPARFLDLAVQAGVF
jgi:hypothetical protein